MGNLCNLSRSVRTFGDVPHVRKHGIFRERAENPPVAPTASPFATIRLVGHRYRTGGCLSVYRHDGRQPRRGKGGDSVKRTYRVAAETGEVTEVPPDPEGDSEATKPEKWVNFPEPPSTGQYL